MQARAALASFAGARAAYKLVPSDMEGLEALRQPGAQPGRHSAREVVVGEPKLAEVGGQGHVGWDGARQLADCDRKPAQRVRQKPKAARWDVPLELPAPNRSAQQGGRHHRQTNNDPAAHGMISWLN